VRARGVKDGCDPSVSLSVCAWMCARAFVC
jgi:hypothetical protein